MRRLDAEAAGGAGARPIGLLGGGLSSREPRVEVPLGLPGDESVEKGGELRSTIRFDVGVTNVGDLIGGKGETVSHGS